MLHPILTVATHFFILLTFALIIAWIDKYLAAPGFPTFVDKAQIFNYHPFFMSFGFLFFSSEAVVAFRILPFERKTRKMIHASFHLLALIFGSIGLWVIFENHKSKNTPDLYSAHSWVGLTAFICYGVQFVLSAAVFGSMDFPSKRIKDMIKPVHMYLGCAFYVLVVITMMLGVFEKITFETTATTRFSPVAQFGASICLFLAFTACVVLCHRGLGLGEDKSTKAGYQLLSGSV